MMEKETRMKTRKMYAVAAAMLTVCAGAAGALGSRESDSKNSLELDQTAYSAAVFELNGEAVAYRGIEGVVYVGNPVDVKYQTMNIYVPEQYFDGGTVNGWTASTAPIFFPNGVGGYMPAEPGKPEPGRDGGPNAIMVALSNGYVVAAPGARGRTTKDENGAFTGKGAAGIVDLKAAVRYLRHNDRAMPGDAEKIVSNGTSAGGALSALLGSSGDAAYFEPYLRALGAARESDAVFAVSAYCPITNLDNADAAYEWQFAGVMDYKKMQISQMIDYRIERKEVAGSLSPEQATVSSELGKLFPRYVNSLGLKAADGTVLSLDVGGQGSFLDYVQSYVARSAQAALDSGADLSARPWISVKDGKVEDIDFGAYVRFMGRMKVPAAFDGLDLSNGENGLFGTATVDARHFTDFGAAHSTVPDAARAEPALVRAMNPMSYLGAKRSTIAANWRIRHGTLDKDTSLAIPAILATALSNSGLNVDLALPWDRPHSGDYDLEELFGWIEAVSR